MYNNLAPKRDDFIRKNDYFYEELYKQYRYFIPKGKMVLEVGCGTGGLLNAVAPKEGYGVDISPEMIKIARGKFPQFNFTEGDLTALKTNTRFDFIVLSGLLGEIEDIQEFLVGLNKFCFSDTRVIIQYYSYFWLGILKIFEKFGRRNPQRIQNWLVYSDIENILKLSGYEVVARERCVLFPKRAFGLEILFNKFLARLPIFNALTVNHFIIARPLFNRDEELSVSIVVPCRNEKGNIESVIKRTPFFGKEQEFIFVEGGSKDGTYEEAERVKNVYKNKKIYLYKQTGKGKGDAVRLGFNRSKGEVLMILDADLTVPPEELPKFYRALKDNVGEFVNGCRLVYPMEKEAMRFLNLIANKFFGIFFSWLLGQRFKDTLCGTKVLFRHHYEEIARNRAYFGDFDPFGDFDLIFGAVKQNLKVIELPIRYKSRQYGTTQIQRFRHGLLLLRMCFFAMKKIKFK
ncbi:MAG: glycosyltransferase [Candidatus Omnitrophica bacterium]|nr:glycosyltransferase [Candidatus Omnitrophota bacterium]